MSVTAQNAVAPLGLAGAFISLVTHGLTSEPTAHLLWQPLVCDFPPQWLPFSCPSTGLWGCIRVLETALCSWQMHIFDVQEPHSALEWELNAGWDSQGHLKCPFIQQVWTYPISSSSLLRNFLCHYCFYTFLFQALSYPFLIYIARSSPYSCLSPNEKYCLTRLIRLAILQCTLSMASFLRWAKGEKLEHQHIIIYTVG